MPMLRKCSVAVVAGERDRALVQHAHESRFAALLRALRPAPAVGGREEEHVGALDKGSVVVGDLAVRQQDVLDPVGEPRVELLLKAALPSW